MPSLLSVTLPETSTLLIVSVEIVSPDSLAVTVAVRISATFNVPVVGENERFVMVGEFASIDGADVATGVDVNEVDAFPAASASTTSIGIVALSALSVFPSIIV